MVLELAGEVLVGSYFLVESEDNEFVGRDVSEFVKLLLWEIVESEEEDVENGLWAFDEYWFDVFVLQFS